MGTQADTLYVAPGGGCGGASPCYASVQAAVDAADNGDVIKIASGTYTDVHARPAPNGYPYPPSSGLITQVVFISRTITLQGGYSTDDWSTSDPAANPTWLDAQGQGRGLYIGAFPVATQHTISPTIVGLRISGGTAEGLGGTRYDAGGGLYVANAAARLENLHIFSNTGFWGGGGHLYYSPATVRNSSITSNTADSGGGGLYLTQSHATLEANRFAGNTATRNGGGIFLTLSHATLTGNQFYDNAATDDRGLGGGLYLSSSDAVLSDNIIRDNSAGTSGGGLYQIEGTTLVSHNAIASNNAIDYHGGGIYLTGDTQSLFSHNSVTANSANSWGGGVLVSTSSSTFAFNVISGNVATGKVYGQGGGLYLHITQYATFAHNLIASNSAGAAGGGLHLFNSTPVFEGNTISDNTAPTGGGIYLAGSDLPMTNNVIADNCSDQEGSGLYLANSSPHMRHTTIARNWGGASSGIHVHSGTPVLTNTVLVDHGVGISITAGQSAILSGVLWYGNACDVGGAGSVSVTHAHTGDPAFADDGHHLTPGSAAIDRGVAVSVTTDMDGDGRPYGDGPDLGADEWVPKAWQHIYLPIALRNG